jgi:hypothetical protein
MRRSESQRSRVRAWTVRLAAALRAGTAMAGASLALIVALNLEVVSIIPPGLATDASSAASREGVPPDAIQQWIEVSPVVPAVEETRTSPGAAVPPAEQLPITRFGRGEPDANVVDSTDATNAVDEPTDVWQVLQVRLVPADRVGMTDGAGDQSGEPGTEEPEPVPDPPRHGPS